MTTFPQSRFAVGRVEAVMDSVMDGLVVPGFSRIGFSLRARSWRDLGDDSLRGRTVILTGHTSGIGLAAARQLRAMGANLVVIGRDATRTGDAARLITASSGDGTVDPLVADMGEPEQIRRVAETVLDRFERVDVVVHNAGALLKTRARNSRGLDATLAVHVYGPHLLTTLLLPALSASRGRVVTVSSGGMYAVGVPRVLDGCSPELPDEKYDGTKQYAIAKRMQVTLNEMWAERSEAKAVGFHAMHPGWVDTPGVASSIPLFRAVTKPILRTPEQGADTVSWLAAADESMIGSGGFWSDRTRRPIHRLPATKRSDTPAARTDLWGFVERIALGDMR